MFLTRSELKRMTNGKRPKEIIKWLQANAPGRFRVALDGWPVVHKEVVDDIFGVHARRRIEIPDVKLDHLRSVPGGRDE